MTKPTLKLPSKIAQALDISFEVSTPCTANPCRPRRDPTGASRDARGAPGVSRPAFRAPGGYAAGQSRPRLRPENYDPYENIFILRAVQQYRNADYFPLPPACRTYSASTMAQAKRDMAMALAAFPRLTTYGFVADPTTDDGNLMGRQIGRRTDEQFAVDRADMSAVDRLAALIALQGWLRINGCMSGTPGKPRINHRLPSGLIAHIAAAEIGFVDNGVVIAAMFVEGYTVVETKLDMGWTGPHGEFNVELRTNEYFARERRLRRE